MNVSKRSVILPALVLTALLSAPAAPCSAASAAAAKPVKIPPFKPAHIPAAKPPAPAPRLSSLTVHVTLNAAQKIVAVPGVGLGLGVAVWDDHMTDSAVPGLIKNAGISLLRYPGGSYADLYHWQDNSATAGTTANIQGADSFDRFMTLANAADAGVLITVNYGSNKAGTGGGDPQEAAAWVHYANAVKKYGVQYWEIGNEVYGNGFYNNNPWEEDLHALPATAAKGGLKDNPSLGPIAYGANVVAYIAAMKSQDPTIKVGAVLTAHGNWPDGVDPDWNENVLNACGEQIDFVVVHVYGGGKTPDELYHNAETDIPQIAAQARAEVNEYCGPNAQNVQIFVTEGDASGWNTRLPGALYAAEQYLLWWENGVANFDWWDLHNGINVNPQEGYGDQGILSNHSSDKGVTEPPLDDPFPPYYGIRMVNYFANPGDQLIRTVSDHPEVSAFAALDLTGRVSLMLINKDSKKAAKVIVTVNGADVPDKATRYDYGQANIPAGIGASTPIVKDSVPLPGNTFPVVVPPNTITDISTSSVTNQ